MIKYMRVENFKAIRKMNLGLGSLNLLFGMNGMGKSSLMQTILLIRQSYIKSGRMNMDQLYINGDLIALGSSRDILCSNAEGNEISFVFADTGDRMNRFVYRADFNSNTNNQLERINKDEAVDYSSALFRDEFIYISAEHLGPQRKYSYSRWDDQGVNSIGVRGEYTVPFLAMYGDVISVPQELCDDKGKTNKLKEQVSAWMKRISPGIRLGTELMISDQEAKLDISYEGDRFVSDSYSPVNVGFGITYVLPLVVALLSAGKDCLILIENPESHLHPKGQSAMAELLCKCAAHGTQIICESHSDHVINGVRVSVKEKLINYDDVMITYFSKNSKMNTEEKTIRIDENGNLDNYPIGLLDEWGELMAKLI